MQSFKKPSPRAAVVVGAAGVLVLGAVGVGATAFADTTPAPSPSPSATARGPWGGGWAGARQHGPHIGGTVQTVDGSTVTVKDWDGFTRTIRLASGVTVTKDGSSSSVAAITKGEQINATGSVASDGTTLDATAVTVGKPTRPAGSPGGKWGPGGMGGPHGPRAGGATPPWGGGPTATPTPSTGT